MGSHYSETSRIRSMNKLIKEQHQKLAKSESILSESLKKQEEFAKRARITEARLQRNVVLNNSLSHLPKKKREVMEELLESVSTSNLEKMISKYLPIVLKEDNTASIKKSLTEGKNLREVTGNKQNVQVVQEDVLDDVRNEVDRIVHLAVNKK